jgi:hypothetical protein
MRISLLWVLVAVPACVPMQRSFVADVHYDEGGNLVANKCDFDYKGRATSVCHDEDNDGAPEQWSPPPDPATLRAAERAVEAAKVVARRRAPTAVSVDHALKARSVQRSLALCKQELAPDRLAFDFSLTVAPTGQITVVPSSAEYADAFASCAARAISGANLGAFDGPEPVTFTEQLPI